MDKNSTFKEQLRRNAVALTSLAIAVTSLGYNTWRNEASEHNRNQRLISIEMLLLLGDLQQLTLDRHYGKNVDGEALSRMGWGKVLTLKDLSRIAEGEVPGETTQLFDTWSSDFDELGTDVAAKDRVIAAIEDLRIATHGLLKSLD